MIKIDLWRSLSKICYFLVYWRKRPCHSLLKTEKGKLIWAWPWLFSLAQFFKECLEAHSIEIDFRWLTSEYIHSLSFKCSQGFIVNFCTLISIYSIEYRGGRYYQTIIDCRYIYISIDISFAVLSQNLVLGGIYWKSYWKSIYWPFSNYWSNYRYRFNTSLYYQWF